MAVAYPGTLPLPLARGSTHFEMDANERNDVKDGPPRIERLTSAPPSMFTVTWRLKPAEMDTFDTWWKDTTLRGALQFTMNLYVGDELRTHTLQFDAPPRMTLQGKLWTVKAKLVAIDKNYG